MKKSALILIAAFWCLAAEPTLAAPYADKKQTSQKRKKSISASQAANKVKSKYGGKVLKVQPSGKGYRVKILKKDGRIISVFVDGTSGKIRG